MFFVLPALAIIFIYLLAAVLPALYLMRYIYRKDKVEKEPPSLLLYLALGGVGAALLSILLETAGIRILSALLREGSTAYNIAFAFLVVAVVEEGTKFLLLRGITWKNPNFNYRFDGIIYAAFISLGFAAFENIRYVMGYGLTVAIPRALLAIPGHLGFSVFMGAFYGRAKLCEKRGNQGAKRANLAAGYLIAVLLHGFYDAAAMIGNVLSTGLFLIFIVVMYIVVIRLIKREAAKDGPI